MTLDRSDAGGWTGSTTRSSAITYKEGKSESAGEFFIGNNANMQIFVGTRKICQVHVVDLRVTCDGVDRGQNFWLAGTGSAVVCFPFPGGETKQREACSLVVA